MKQFIIFLSIFFFEILKSYQYPDAQIILKKIDQNFYAETQKIEGKMIVYGKRINKEFAFITYIQGEEKSFTEYLNPPSQRGTKMLKLKENLWIYSPSSDRTIQLSGHMLKQSVMGSDVSYEDLMERHKLLEKYHAKVVGEEICENKDCWILDLEAKVEDVSYHKIKIWVDKLNYNLIKEELYAKSGQILKSITFNEYKKIGNRWYPVRMNYKDILKGGKGTDFIIDKVEFDINIDPYLFTKGVLKK